MAAYTTIVITLIYFVVELVLNVRRIRDVSQALIKV